MSLNNTNENNNMQETTSETPQPNVVVVSGCANQDGATPFPRVDGQHGYNDQRHENNPMSSDDGSSSSGDEHARGGNARRVTGAQYNSRSLTPPRQSPPAGQSKSNRVEKKQRRASRSFDELQREDALRSVTDTDDLPEQKPKRRYAETKDFKHLGMEKFKGEEVLPSFYGLEDWFAQGDQAIQDHSDMMNVHWTDDARRMAFRQHLEGKARSWYTQRYKTRAPKLEDLMTDMRTAFGMSNDTMYISNMIQAARKKNSESYESYARGLERLAQSGPAHAYDVMMEAVVRSFAKNANPKHSAILTVLIPKSGKNKNFFSQDILASMVETLVSIDGTGAGTETPAIPISKLSEPEKEKEQSRGFQGECFYCHRRFHRAADCKKKKFDERNDRGRGGRQGGMEQHRPDRGNYGGDRNRGRSSDNYGGGRNDRGRSQSRDDYDGKDSKTYFPRGN